MHMIEKKLPVLDSRFYPEMEESNDEYRKGRGTLAVQFAPFVNGPIPLKNPKPVTVELHLNTVHFNVIPFLAFLLASPFVNWKRFLIFLFGGFIFLSATHIAHIYLDLLSYYFKLQTFEFNPSQMAPAQLKSAYIWHYQRTVINSFQTFMEQAGSMIMPAFIWLIYAARWIFKSLLKKQEGKTVL